MHVQAPPTFRTVWCRQLSERISLEVLLCVKAPPTFRRIMWARWLCEGVSAARQLGRQRWWCRWRGHGFAVLEHLGLLATLQFLTHLLHTTRQMEQSCGLEQCTLPGSHTLCGTMYRYTVRGHTVSYLAVDWSHVFYLEPHAMWSHVQVYRLGTYS